jgi:hypothetical protein
VKLDELQRSEAGAARAWGKDELDRVNHLLAVTDDEFRFAPESVQVVLLDAATATNGSAELAIDALRDQTRRLEQLNRPTHETQP